MQLRKTMKVSEIKLMFPQPQTKVGIDWKHLEEHIQDRIEKYGLEINPDFQRGHVWQEDKQSKYVEYCLRGGSYHRDLLFNHPGWMSSFEGDFVLVDGLQRLTAVRKFMKNELSIFDGVFLNDFDEPKKLISHQSFFFCINTLQTRAEVLEWYIEMNTGGVVHSEEEIERVKKLLAQETK